MATLSNNLMHGISSGMSFAKLHKLSFARTADGLQKYAKAYHQLDRVANSLDNLAGALTKLAKAIGGLKGGTPPYIGGPKPMPMPTPFPGPVSGETPPVSEEPMAPIAGKGRIWGDPHFIGADGGKFDVQGKAGKYYNLLSDKGFQMNGRFDSWGNKGATVVGQVSINLTGSGDNIFVEKTGEAYINGKALGDGQTVTLDDGTKVTKRGKRVLVQSKEWKVDIETRKDHINMDVSTKNAVSDGVRPHGLLGQTFDGDGKARNGDKGTGAQGGGAIEGLNGNIISRGDKKSIEAYEVENLFDTDFKNFNHNQEDVPDYFGDLGIPEMGELFSELNMSLDYAMGEGQNVKYF